MKLFLLKDIPNLGMAHEMVDVSDGFARNFLLPRQVALEVTPHNETALRRRMRVVERRKEVVVSKTSLLAEKIKSLKLTLKAKVHDGDKLYGAIAASDIVDLLAAEGVRVAKNQIIFDKAIKTKGMHTIVVKLSNTLQPSFSLKVVAE
jgi:large subunit ribosomal protein L9